MLATMRALVERLHLRFGTIIFKGVVITVRQRQHPQEPACRFQHQRKRLSLDRDHRLQAAGRLREIRRYPQRIRRGGRRNRLDLEPFIGRSKRVYEVLSHKRPLTLGMIRRLHHDLGIPAEILIAVSVAD